MLELLYTSAPRGLKSGSRGFCTVLSTQGIVAPLAEALEGLSGYRPVYPTGDPLADQNPVVFAHVKLQAAGKSWQVLSRIADFGADYSDRSNKLAHHIALDRAELPAAGPASLLRKAGVMRTDWDGEPRLVAPRKINRSPNAPTGVCQAWKDMTGDAGWAGVLAESFLKEPTRPVFLLFEPGQDLLPLFDEALSLLPPERRWEVTFSTYFTGPAQGLNCLWRGLIHDSKEAHESQRFVQALRIDLTAPVQPRAAGGELVEAARLGRRPHSDGPVPPSLPTPPGLPSEDDIEELAGPPPLANEAYALAPDAPTQNPSGPPRLTPSLFGDGPPPRGRLGSPDANSHRTWWLAIGVASVLVACIAVGVGIWLALRPGPPPAGGSRKHPVVENQKQQDAPKSSKKSVKKTADQPATRSKDAKPGGAKPPKTVNQDAQVPEPKLMPDVTQAPKPETTESPRTTDETNPTPSAPANPKSLVLEIVRQNGKDLELSKADTEVAISGSIGKMRSELLSRKGSHLNSNLKQASEGSIAIELTYDSIPDAKTVGTLTLKPAGKKFALHFDPTTVENPAIKQELRLCCLRLSGGSDEQPVDIRFSKAPMVILEREPSSQGIKYKSGDNTLSDVFDLFRNSKADDLPAITCNLKLKTNDLQTSMSLKLVKISPHFQFEAHFHQEFLDQYKLKSGRIVVEETGDRQLNLTLHQSPQTVLAVKEFRVTLDKLISDVNSRYAFVYPPAAKIADPEIMNALNNMEMSLNQKLTMAANQKSSKPIDEKTIHSHQKQVEQLKKEADDINRQMGIDKENIAKISEAMIEAAFTLQLSDAAHPVSLTVVHARTRQQPQSGDNRQSE